MSLSDNSECVLGDINSELNIVIGYCGIHKVIVVRSKEQTSAYTFRNPLLMKHKAVIVSDTKIEKCGFTGNFKIKAVLLTCGNKTVTKLSTLFLNILGVSSLFILGIQARQAANGSALIQ